MRKNTSVITLALSQPNAIGRIIECDGNCVRETKTIICDGHLVAEKVGTSWVEIERR